jgi:hypothetical protein
MTDVVATSWSEISPTVKRLNRQLFDVIESDASLRSHNLSIYRYKYGDPVGDEQYFYGPSTSNIKQKIIPFSMILQNSFEMPVKISNKVIPWKIYKPGNIFPYARFLERNQDYEPIHDLSMFSGSKSAFLMVNKIADQKWHTLFCNKYKIDTPPPKSFSDHFNIFKLLCDSNSVNWRAELLVFPESFFEVAYKHHDFKEMIYKTSLNEKLFKSNLYAYETLLDIVFRNDTQVRSDFVSKCIRNIFYIGCGDRPAYFPTDNEYFAPVEFITEAYIEGFKSKSTPVIMVPDFMLPFENKNHAYFSLNKLNYLIKPDKLSSQAKIIRDVKTGFDYIKDDILRSEFSPDSIFYKNALKLTVNPLVKNDSDYINNLQADPILSSLSNRYKLPIPENSTFSASSLSIHYAS